MVREVRDVPLGDDRRTRPRSCWRRSPRSTPVIAFYYYARVIKAIWLDDPVGEFADGAEAAPAGSLKLALGIAVALTIAIGVYPSIAAFVGEAAQVLATGG